MAVAHKFKHVLRSRVARSRPFALFVASLERLDRYCPNRLRVLTYHRVDVPENQASLGPRLISATPNDDLDHIRQLVDRRKALRSAQVSNGT